MNSGPDVPDDHAAAGPGDGLTRRQILLGAGAGVLLAGAAGTVGFAVGRGDGPHDSSVATEGDEGRSVPAAGVHQAGVALPAVPAHPSYTGSRLMLRRSYSYRDSDTDHGHLFISHQNDVQAFAKTQLRLDDEDDLMRYVTPTATAAFAVLPGTLDAAGTPRALGSTLF